MPLPKIWTKEIVLAGLLNAVENARSLRIKDYPGRFAHCARIEFGSWANAVRVAANIAGIDVRDRTKRSGGRSVRNTQGEERVELAE